MNVYLKNSAAFLFLLLNLVFQGCISVPVPEESMSSQPEMGEERSKDETVALVLKASTGEEVQQAIDLLKSLHAKMPQDVEVLSRLSNLYIFKGAAEETKVSRKRGAYVEALRYAEAAMMLSPEFRDRIEGGDRVWDAIDVLDETYLPAMSFWSTALFYQFDECLNKIVKPLNLRWIRRAETVLGRAYALAPDWGGGQLYFSYGIYYLMPAVAGGDMAKSEEFFEKAVATGPDWLLNRWGRGRYFYKKTGDKDLLRADLEWVVAQDASTASGPLCWNLYCQQDAQAILDEL